MDEPSYQAPDYSPLDGPIGSLPPNHGGAVVNARGHFPDFIQNFLRLHNEKRRGLEKEQLHLNEGLYKIAETEAQDEEMQKSLAVESTELETKNKEAEKQAQQSIEINQMVDKQTKEITIKKAEVIEDLE